MRSLSRSVRKKLILIYFTAWNVSKQRINKKQHHPIHLQMPFPPPASKTMGLPVLVDLLKTRATAALVTDLCAFRWRVICLRRAECFTKLMNINTYNTCYNWQKLLNKMSHIRIDLGSCGLNQRNQRGYSISSPVFSGEVGVRAGGSDTTKSVPKRLSAIWDVWEQWESRNVSLWNPEYRKILQLQESRIPLTITIQIHVPQWSWLESGIYGVESRIQDCVKFPRRWGKISRQETYYVNTRSEKTGGSQKRFFCGPSGLSLT